MSAEAKIDAAAKATGGVQDLVGKVLDLLKERFSGSIVNEYGVYADPSTQRSYLREAKSVLEAATQLMNETEWPSPKDYGSGSRPGSP